MEKEKKEVVSTTPTTSNKSSKVAAKKKTPKETSIVVVTEEKSRESSEKDKNKVIGFMSKISNELLKSANEANKTILRAKDKAVTLALSDPWLNQLKRARRRKQ